MPHVTQSTDSPKTSLVTVKRAPVGCRSLLKGIALSSHCVHLLDSMIDWNPKTREPAVSLLTFPFYAELRERFSKHHALTSCALTDSELYGIVGLAFQRHASQLGTVGARRSKGARKPVGRSNGNSRPRKSRVNDAAALGTIDEDPLGEVSWSGVGSSSSGDSSSSSRISSRNRSGASSGATRTPTRSKVINEVLKESLSPSPRTPPPRSRAPSPAALSPARAASPGTATPSGNKCGDSPSPIQGADDAATSEGSSLAMQPKRSKSIWMSAVAAASDS